MKINIGPVLDQRGARLEFQGKEALVLEGLNFKKPVTVNLFLTNIGKGILVEGKVEGTLLLSCGHCLTEFLFPFQTSLCEEYVGEGTSLPGLDKETALEELSIFTYGQDQMIDPGEAIRQALLLNLPMQPVCSPSCKGLCPSCGKNRNEGECGCPLESTPVTEDRWAPLKLLKKEFGVKPKKRRTPRA